MAPPKENSEVVKWQRVSNAVSAGNTATSSEPPMPILEVQDFSSVSPPSSPPHLSPQTNDAKVLLSASTSTAAEYQSVEMKYQYQCQPMRKAAGWALLNMKGVAWKSSALRSYQDRTMSDSDESLDNDPLDDKKTDRDYKPSGRNYVCQLTSRFGHRVLKPKVQRTNRKTGRRGGRTGTRSRWAVSVPARLTRRNARRRLVKRTL